MNLSHYITPQLIDECHKHSSIVILGIPNSGKTTLATELAKQLNYPLIISDDYFIKGNQEKSLENLMNIIQQYRGKFIVEGVMCYRLLRKGAQTNLFLPDMLINLNCSVEHMIRIYNRDGEYDKIKYAITYVKGLNTIFMEYQNILKNNPSIRRPKYVEINTSIY
jgi:deoxyadenosine/deoxycytidine kinase